MADYKISQLTPVTPTSDDLLEVSHTTDSGATYNTGSATVGDIVDKAISEAIDDTTTSLSKTWSSDKISGEIEAVTTLTTGSCELNTTNTSAGDVQFAKYGDLIVISGYFLPSNGNNQAVVFTLPYAPASSINVASQTDQSPYCVYLAVNTSETNVRIGTHPANSYVRFNFVYIKQ